MKSTIENPQSPMKLAYIAGPYRAGSEYEMHCNIQVAEKAAAHAWRKGYPAICPHKNTAYMDGVVAIDQILAGDMEMLRRCNVLILCGAWQRSQGACAELGEAIRQGMELFEYCEMHGPRLVFLQPADAARRMARHDYNQQCA